MPETEGGGSASAGTGAGGGSGGQWHTVKRGESLWAIAGKYGVSLTELINLNPQIKNPNRILVGEKVRVK